MSRPLRALVVADGAAPTRPDLDEAWPGWDDGRGIAVDMVPTDKDASDTELGVLAAIAAGDRSVVILGALGGPRPDHARANVSLLGHPAAAGCAVTILDPMARIRLLAGRAGQLSLTGRVGDVVSLIPLETTTGITTSGLRYALAGATLDPGPARGISNVRTATEATVVIRRGRLLLVEAPARLSR
ncbi:MAG: thiamine diphosphokinase [Chloroflexi bacterium]|nr:thiamine diphosphokinase [Chloroflexota bacterium]